MQLPALCVRSNAALVFKRFFTLVAFFSLSPVSLGQGGCSVLGVVDDVEGNCRLLRITSLLPLDDSAKNLVT